MVKFTAMLEKYGKMGEKTGWTYIDIPSHIAEKINSGVKKSFRIKGKLDNIVISGVSLLPIGDGNFILPVNASMRKEIKKIKGEKVLVKISTDNEELKTSSDLLQCLKDDRDAKKFFDSLPKSHKNYYSKWIESAKTNATKAKRIAQSVNGFKMKMGYPEMIRYYKSKKHITLGS